MRPTAPGIHRALPEWGELAFGPDPQHRDTIPEDLAHRLARTANASPLAGRGGGGVLTLARDRLKARGIVGMVAVEGGSIEILPKIDGAGDLRRLLVHMLSVALDLDIDLGALVSLEEQDHTLLEIVITAFVSRLQANIRDGLPRHYRPHEDDLPALRGSLDMVRQFTRHAVNPSRLACRFDALTEDIALNRLIKAALTQLSRLARHPDNRQKLGALLDAYDGVSAITPGAGRRVMVHLDRTNRQWADLVALARLVLSGQYQSTTHGGQAGFALLFEMHALFEAYCTRMLTRSLAPTPYSVKRQGGRRSCLTDNRTGAPVFETRPDILIRRGDDIAHIIDTKWKRMARPDRDPDGDPKCGMAQGDVYQVMAYAGLYEVSRLTLLYPHHAGLGEADGVKARFGINPGHAQLTVASIDLTDPRTIRERLRRLVIDHVPDRG